MLRRTWYLLAARLAMARRGGNPVPALVFLATLAAVLALLVRDALPTYPYLLCALSIGTGLLALPLLSDLAVLLRHDEGADWVAALPVREGDLLLARTLHVLILLGTLSLAWFVPWALLAPPGTEASARAGLVFLGFLGLMALAAALFWTQQLLLARLQSLFVALETVLVVLVVVGLLQLLGHLPELALLVPTARETAWFPPVWLARALFIGGWDWGPPLLLGTLSLVVLTRLPVRIGPHARRRGGLELLLAPVRRLALRFWVRPDERGSFELVYRGLPREREVALRTYPMLGIPLAFLWIAARGSHAADLPWRGDLLALLLFTAGIYLPLLLTQVPLTETPAASWVLRAAPVSRAAIAEGAIKALFVRWLLPLYLLLLGLGLVLGEAELLLRLWLPTTLLGLVLLRILYSRCVRDLPLSTAPEELRGEVDWAGLLTTLSMALTVVAVLANRTLGWGSGLALALVLGGFEALLERRRLPFSSATLPGRKDGPGVPGPSSRG